MVNVRTLSFARAMHHEATKPSSVTVRGWVRECKGSSAPGESPEETLSDRGSTPLASTRIRSVELGFIRNMFALAIEIEVNR